MVLDADYHPPFSFRHVTPEPTTQLLLVLHGRGSSLSLLVAAARACASFARKFTVLRDRPAQGCAAYASPLDGAKMFAAQRNGLTREV